MSRNLGRTHCECRGQDVLVLSEPHPITEREAGRYFDEYAGMLVADAECQACGSRYLAWVNQSSMTGTHRAALASALVRPGTPGYLGFFDLSYRSTFNDEPGPADLPVWLVDQFGSRAAPIDDASAAMLWTGMSDADFAAWRSRRDSAAYNCGPVLGPAMDRYRLALRAVLLFHSPSPWDGAKQAEWESVTGRPEATTKALCDMIRRVLGEKEERS